MYRCSVARMLWSILNCHFTPRQDTTLLIDSVAEGEELMILTFLRYMMPDDDVCVFEVTEKSYKSYKSVLLKQFTELEMKTNN